MNRLSNTTILSAGLLTGLIVAVFFLPGCLADTTSQSSVATVTVPGINVHADGNGSYSVNGVLYSEDKSFAGSEFLVRAIPDSGFALYSKTFSVSGIPEPEKNISLDYDSILIKNVTTVGYVNISFIEAETPSPSPTHRGSGGGRGGGIGNIVNITGTALVPSEDVEPTVPSTSFGPSYNDSYSGIIYPSDDDFESGENETDGSASKTDCCKHKWCLGKFTPTASLCKMPCGCGFCCWWPLLLLIVLIIIAYVVYKKCRNGKLKDDESSNNVK